MKKILTLLFVSMLMIAMPSTVFADQNDNEVTGESATVELYAAVASQYTVKLPLRVDVSATSTTFNVFAKGSIAADKQLSVSVGSGTHTLADTINGSNRSYALTLNVSGGTFAADTLEANYSDSIKSVFTVTHAALAAGNYSYNLPIVIALENIPAD
ncbi:MAG: hypothetical protein IJU42_01080 [Erysipelotrichaceae bacterium]|jgi:hypothetical protein|nr:hypothetical protein [Erysipelotrichaceae bacterium]